ncbi:hypothetical protein HY411_00150 [Candidatus Gottesmanbacteria bacterium]|nr:hypothetical protein [Candidatus Gottesmanbacteria bacterium]
MDQSTITISEFSKVEMRVGKVVEATHPEKSKKLIRLVVDFGLKNTGDMGNTGDQGEEHEVRVIFTGVRGFGYTKEDFLEKQFFFVVNLAPRKMIGEESQGMILAVDPGETNEGEAHSNEKPLFISAEGMPVGAKVR